MVSAPTATVVSAARSRLLETAGRLFYAEGIRGVGVDRVIAEARITRATFYRHFPSKDDLITAYLAVQDQAIRNQLTEAVALGLTPAQLLHAVVTGLTGEICRSGFRGCPFINAAAEFPDPEHPVHLAVLAHRRWFRDSLIELATAARAADPIRLGQALVLLRDGVMVGGDLDETQAAADALAWAADSLIVSSLPEGECPANGQPATIV